MRPELRRRHKGVWLAFALFVAIATPTIELLVPHTVRVPEPTVDLAGPWEILGRPAELRSDGQELRLVNHDPTSDLVLRMVRDVTPSVDGLYRISATIAADDLVASRPEFPFAEMKLTGNGDARPGADGATGRVAGLRGTVPAETYTRYLYLGRDTNRVVLSIRLPYMTGGVTVQKLRLHGYRTAVAYGAASTVLTMAWALLLVTGGFLFWRGATDRRLVYALLAVVPVGILLIVMPNELREVLIGWIAEWIGLAEVSPEVVAKTGHFGLFVAVGLLTRLSRPRDRAWVQLTGLALAGGAGELLQFMAAGRHPALFDWFVNGSGGAVGWSLASLWLARYGVVGQPSTQTSSDRTSPPQDAKQLR